MLVDRVLRASLCASADAIVALLRCAAQRALDMVAGAPSEAPSVPAGVHTKTVPLAQPTPVGVLDAAHGGTPSEGARQTVPFGLDGQTYEIDLSDEDATELRRSLQRYVDAGRRARQKPGSGNPAGSALPGAPCRERPAGSALPGPRRAREQRADSAAIREWARTQGHAVADRGRIPANVAEAYAVEHRAGRTHTTK